MPFLECGAIDKLVGIELTDGKRRISVAEVE
jgi:hypothetical protein